jgi:NAD(P)-dependent dehydrogenase (short-subunit alcohol dehydrogenase family)
MGGRHFLITGGTGGLGRGVVTVALAQGADLTLPYVKPEEVERLQSGLSSQVAERITFVSADLSDEAAVMGLISRIEQLDATIHLVGGFAMGPTPEFSYADWRHQLDLNLNTTFLVLKHSLHKMLTQNYGRIVTVGSRGAEQPTGQLAAYCAAKAGVVALTKAIADETKGTDITANVVLPSVINTPANRAAMGDGDAHRWVKPESLGEVICFLASDAARDIRGAAIPVYGSL